MKQREIPESAGAAWTPEDSLCVLQSGNPGKRSAILVQEGVQDGEGSGGGYVSVYETCGDYCGIAKTRYVRQRIEIAKEDSDDTRVQNAENIYKELFDNSSSEKE